MEYAGGVIERSALGRDGYLGALYDAREEQFVHGSLFTTFDLPDTCVSRQDIPSVFLEYTTDDSYTEKFNKLDINAELKLSVLAGTVSLSGSGAYLSDVQSSSRSVKGTVIYNIKTKQEKVNVYQEELRNHISANALKFTSATHFVGGIGWGANTFVSFEYVMNKSEDKRDISGALSASANAFAVSVQGKGGATISDEDINISTKFKIKIFGDILPIDETLPNDASGALKMLRTLPTNIAKVGDGRGSPLTYYLYPLEDVANLFGFKDKINSLAATIDIASVLQVEQTFNELQTSQGYFNDFYYDLTSSKVSEKPHIPRDTLDDILSFKNNMDISLAKFRNDLRVALVKDRSQMTNSTNVNQALAAFYSTKYSPDKILSFIDKYSYAVDKVEFINELSALNVTYSTSKVFDVSRIRLKEKNFYALVFREKNYLYKSEKFVKNFDLFTKIVHNQGNYSVSYTFHLIEVTSLSKNPDKIEVAIFQGVNGNIESTDFLERLMENRGVNLAQSFEFETSYEKPTKTSSLKIRCPGWMERKCSLHYIQFKCNNVRCGLDIDYGFDGYLYCSCGRAALDSYSFKCTDKNHGHVWMKFRDSADILKMIEAREEETHVLMLNNTGIEIAGFLNALVNFSIDSTISKAENVNLQIVASQTIKVLDKDSVERSVSLDGQPDFQNLTEQSYRLDLGSKIIVLTVTPKAKNLLDMLQLIKKYKSHEIKFSEIWFLLGNELNELHIVDILSAAHKDVIYNLKFLVVDSKPSSLESNKGSSPWMTVLGYVREAYSSRLHKSIYNIDMETFYFFAAKQNNVQFKNSEVERFELAWMSACSEVSRLLQMTSKEANASIAGDILALAETANTLTILERRIPELWQVLDEGGSNAENLGESWAKLWIYLDQNFVIDFKKSRSHKQPDQIIPGKPIAKAFVVAKNLLEANKTSFQRADVPLLINELRTNGILLHISRSPGFSDFKFNLKYME